MNKERIVLHENNGFVNFFGVVTRKDDYYLNMDVFEVSGWGMDNLICEEDVELYVRVSIKWDGCSHVWFGEKDGDGQNGYLHLCGKTYWERHSELMLKIYDYASKNIKLFDKSIAD